MIDVLSDLFILRGVPGHVRSDNGPEFIAKAVQDWITAVGAKTAGIWIARLARASDMPTRSTTGRIVLVCLAALTPLVSYYVVGAAHPHDATDP